MIAHRRPAIALATVAAALLVARAAPAAASSAVATFEAIACGSWRTSIDVNDRAPGFQAKAGGGELFVGVAWNWVGLAAGARARGGSVGRCATGACPSDTFVEAGGDLALQLLLGDRVRLRLGGEGGRAFLPGAASWYTGGFIESTFDVVQLGTGRAAIVFNVRLDVDVYMIVDEHFPETSTALAAGFGVRY